MGDQEKLEFRNSSAATQPSPSYGYMSKQRTLVTIKESLIRYLSKDIHEELQIFSPNEIDDIVSEMEHNVQCCVSIGAIGDMLNDEYGFTPGNICELLVKLDLNTIRGVQFMTPWGEPVANM